MVGWSILTAQLIVILIVSAGEFGHFNLSFDFAIFHQAWYEIAHGNIDPQATFLGTPFWRNESAFIIWLLAPLYYLYPHAIDLLWVQDLAAVGAELVAFLWLVEALERRHASHGTNVWITPYVALALMLANPWIYLTIVMDFHVETLATLFLVLAGRELWRHRPARAWIWAGAALLTGTVGGLCVVGLGIAGLLARAPAIRRQSLAFLAVGFGWIGMIVGLPSDLGGGADAYVYLKGPGTQPSGVRGLLALGSGFLIHPDRAFNVITARANLLYENFAPFGYAGILWLWAGPVIIVLAMVSVLNSNRSFISPSFQGFPYYVLGAAGTAMVLARIGEWKRGRLLALLLAAGLAANAIFFSVSRMPQVFHWYTVTGGAADQLGHVLDRTPADAEVISSFGIPGRFAGRRQIYLLAPPHSGLVGAPPHPSLPVRERTVVFVFAPYDGNAAVNAVPAIPYVRDQLQAQVLTERAGVYAFLWHPPPGIQTVVLPFP
jgi:hypothetical protein